MREELINEDFLHELRKLCEKKVDDTLSASDVTAEEDFEVAWPTSSRYGMDGILTAVIPLLPAETGSGQEKPFENKKLLTGEPGIWMEKIMSFGRPRWRVRKPPPKGSSYKVSEWLE